MAPVRGKPKKNRKTKISKGTIQAISRAGKSQTEEDVFHMVCREVRDAFTVYLEALSVNDISQLESNTSFRSLLKKCNDKFFDLFSERVKGKSDMFARLQVRWYEVVVRKVLCGSDVQNIEKETPFELDSDSLKSLISCYVESLFSACCRFVRQRQEDFVDRGNVSDHGQARYVVEDDVSLLKLGSVAVLKQKRRLQKTVNSLSNSTTKQSFKRILLTEISTLESMEDKEKDTIPTFIRSLDTGNLLVVKREVLPFLRAFSKVFRHVVNQREYNLLGRKLFKVAEHHVMSHTGLKKLFFNTLLLLNTHISPSIKQDLYNRLLRKVYNVRCNEFLRSVKCLEENIEQKTQDRQVMLRNVLKVS